MKNKFKFLALAIMALLSVNLAWGDSKTYSYTDFDGCGASGGAAFSKDLDDFNFNSSSGRGNTSSGYLQLMSGSTLTVSSSTATLTSIAFTCTANTTSSYGPAKITLKSGEKGSYSYSGKVGTWTYATGTKSVTFSLSAQARVTQIVVTYSAAATPTITKTANLTDFTYEAGSGPSAAQSFTVGGSNLTANITVSAPTNFEVSKSSGSGYASSVTLSPSSGTVSNTTIYVRMKSGLSQGTGKGGNISLTSTGATTQTIAVIGTVTAPAAKHNVNWYVNGVKSSTTQVAEGATITLPTAPSAPSSCSDKVFYGWTTTANYSHATQAPSIISSPIMGTSDLNYYAVFVDASAGGGGSGVDQIVKSDWGTQGTATSGSEMSFTTAHGIVVSSTKGYYGGTNTYAQFYANDVITITPASGMTITQIVFTASGTSNNGWQGTNPAGVVSSNIGSISGNSSNVATTWTGSATTAIEVSHNKQMRLVTIDITYSCGTSYSNYTTTCASCTNKITITKGTPSHGSFTLTGAGTDICADESVTVTLSNITADAHYHATAVTSSNGGSPSAISGGSATVSGITASTTINVTFAEDTKVTVTLLNNNAPVNAGGFDAQGKKEYYTGETLGTLPTLNSGVACDATSTTFMGWTTEQISTKRPNAPTFVNASTTVTGNMTLRAVWAKAE